MLGRIYTYIFIFIIISSLWYQRVYLNSSAIEFNAQLMAESAVLPTMTGNNYNSLTYENGIFKSAFSGKNFVYFSNKHFEATENLVYQEIDSAIKSSSQSSQNNQNIILKTNKALGEILVIPSDNNQALMGKNKVKSMILPNMVYFNIGNNVGKTSGVFIDMLKRTMQSEDPLESSGPDGSIKGVGFFYAISEGEFKIKSDVEGIIMPTQFQNK